MAIPEQYGVYFANPWKAVDKLINKIQRKKMKKENEYKIGDQLYVKATVVGYAISGPSVSIVRHAGSAHTNEPVKFIPFPEYEQGEMVEISDSGKTWKPRLYLFSQKGRHYVLTGTRTEIYEKEKDLAGYIIGYPCIRKIPKKDEISIKLIINGKEASPMDLSEESWTAIREVLKK